uniref:Uncharacterized protein n=1 Tax=Glossina austeni TaxID=7395 RepID=A0A1A9UEB1_GLOAU
MKPSLDNVTPDRYHKANIFQETYVYKNTALLITANCYNALLCAIQSSQCNNPDRMHLTSSFLLAYSLIGKNLIVCVNVSANLLFTSIRRRSAVCSALSGLHYELETSETYNFSNLY